MTRVFDNKRNKTVMVIDEQVKERWDKTKTTRQNYEELGLVFDPNADQEAAANPIDLQVPNGPGKAEPYLTVPEIINCREMITKHGSDYQSMWRDIKVNTHQHTRVKLRKMCELYLKEYAHRDPLFQPKEQDE